MTAQDNGYGYDNRGRGDDRRDERAASADEARAKLPPEGRTRVKCLDAVLAEASTGNEQIAAQCEITADGDHKGYALPWYGSFTDKAREYTVRGMHALGFEGNDVTDLSSMLKGEEAVAIVEHTQDPEDGTWRARIAWLYPTGVAVKQKLEGAKLMSFAKEMKGYLMHTGGSSQPSGNDRRLPPAGNRDERRGGRDDGRDVPPPRDDDMPWNTRGRGGR